MASSGYQAWSVIAGETPTTAKWNLLGANDASFNTGQGFNDAIVVKRHLGMRKSAVMAYRDVEGTDFTTTGTVIFNKTYYNVGNDYNVSTGVYTCPVDGIYIVSFDCYTNNATGRSQVYWNRGATNMIDSQHDNAGKTIIHVPYALAGDTFNIGGSTGFPVNFYAAKGHNQFCVSLLYEM